VTSMLRVCLSPLTIRREQPHCRLFRKAGYRQCLGVLDKAFPTLGLPRQFFVVWRAENSNIRDRIYKEAFCPDGWLPVE
jgi:hypothetical protein